MPPFHAPKPMTISSPHSILSHHPPRLQIPFSKTRTIVHNHTPNQFHHTSRPASTLRQHHPPTFSFPTRPPQHRLLTTTPSYNAAPTTPPTNESTALSTDEYHRLSDTYIDTLVAQLEAMQEEREDVDVEYSAGVLTLVLPPNGTYVLNKQPPNKQIWLSSPISGPKRYDWVASKTGGGEAPEGGLGEGREGEWVYLRDGSTLSELLGREVGVEMDGVAVDD